MKNTSKAIAVLSLMALSATACSPEGGDETDEVELSFAFLQDTNHPNYHCGAETLQEHMEGTGVSISTYPGGQLGDEEELLEQVASGALEMALASSSFQASYVPELAVLDAPYLFEGADDLQRAIESETVTELWDEFTENSGVHVLGGWYYGTRHLTANVEVRGPEDLAGVKIRTPDAPLYLTAVDILGGTATPMALGEVYIGLQQGVIDAQENPIPTISSYSFDEVQEYVNLTGHMVNVLTPILSTDAREQLSDEQYEELLAGTQVAADAVEECIIEEEESILEEWREDESITIVEDIDQDVFRERAAEMIDERFDWSPLYQELQTGS